MNHRPDSRLYYLIGTTVELIKVMPVMRACAETGLSFDIVASGQNDIRASELLRHCGKDRVDVVLHEGPIQKTVLGLFLWFLRTIVRAAFLLRRLPYMEFMQVLAGAQYVVTDGGSNQEECYYLGKPCLVLRRVTECTEGLGENVLLSRLDMGLINEFLENPGRYRRLLITAEEWPSGTIVRTLQAAARSAE